MDIVDVIRIESAVKKWGERFLKRVFTENELNYCLKKTQPYTSLSARFAAKEALIKALRADVPLSFKEIETVNDEKGAPLIKLYGRTKEVFTDKVPNGRIHLSLSHERNLAIAFVIIEGGA